jgi:hypothetical protein
MSNGIGKNPLDDISKVYLETVAKEGYDKPDEKLKTDRNMFNIPKDEQKAARERLLKKTAAKRAAAMEALDPVGKEDGDVNNDGKKDSTDSYLMKRRKAIGAAMKKKMKEQAEIARAEEKAIEEEEIKVAEEIEQKKFEAVKAKLAKEGKSNWRDDLSDLIEVAPMTDTESEKKIKEKKVENRIKINPKLGEAVEEIGGEIIEMTEVEEGDPRDEAAMKKFQALQKNVDQKKKLNIRGYDSAEQKKRLEKKRGMKMDDHPQYKKEEVEQVDENRAAARAAGGYKDDSKKQPDPSKKGFTGIGNMSIDQIRKMSARIEKEKTKKEEVEVAEADDPKSDAMLAKKKQMLQKQYMLDKMRMQMQKQGKLPMGSQRSGSAMESTESNIDEKINPLLKGILKKTPKGEDPEKGGVPYKKTGKMTEGLSVDDQMKISRDAAKNRNPKPDHKAIRAKMLRKPLPKDTRTDAQKMTDAVGKPRMGSSD